jgi:glucan-binding YG repeat protein
MTYEEFIQSVNDNDTPPNELSNILKSLWHAEKGNWDLSHTIAQDIHNSDGSWVHANLHREEGDLGNARYWYNRAGKPESTESVENEREQLICYFLDR